VLETDFNAVNWVSRDFVTELGTPAAPKDAFTTIRPFKASDNCELASDEAKTSLIRLIYDVEAAASVATEEALFMAEFTPLIPVGVVADAAVAPSMSTPRCITRASTRFSNAKAIWALGLL
jgi:hypothetical protein